MSKEPKREEKREKREKRAERRKKSCGTEDTEHPRACSRVGGETSQMDWGGLWGGGWSCGARRVVRNP